MNSEDNSGGRNGNRNNNGSSNSIGNRDRSGNGKSNDKTNNRNNVGHAQRGRHDRASKGPEQEKPQDNRALATDKNADPDSGNKAGQARGGRSRGTSEKDGSRNVNRGEPSREPIRELGRETERERESSEVSTTKEVAATTVQISQSVAILVDGNNIERSIHSETNNTGTMVNFDTLIPRLLKNRALNRMIYFREGKNISSKLSERLHSLYHGSVVPCHKSADIPLTIKAMQLAQKVDTIIIMSGDSDYIELVRHLKTEGVRVEIAAVTSTTSNHLLGEADYFHPLSKDDWFTLHVNKNRPTR
jgi:uncharacterized LabA/DUF88 family protein